MDLRDIRFEDAIVIYNMRTAVKFMYHKLEINFYIR